MPDQGVTLNARIQYKKDTDANWTSNNPVLLENELIIVEMENGECRLKIGDGTHPYVELPFISLGFSGVLGIEHGGTGDKTVLGARSKLGTPAEIQIDPETGGFPFQWGTVVTRGNIGNVIGQAHADNYYWGVDSDATLWGGSQINGATEVNWKPAMMMNSDEQRFHNLFTGMLNAGQSMTLSNGNKYATLIIGVVPNSSITTCNMVTVPTDDLGVYVLSFNNSGVVEQIFVKVAYLNSNDLTIYVENGLVLYIWGILKYRK